MDKHYVLSQKTQKGFSFEIIQQYFFFNIKKVKKLRTLRILTILSQKAQKGFGFEIIQQYFFLTLRKFRN